MNIESLCPEWSEEIKEGLARICVPKKNLYLREDGVYEPAWAPVFYNPVMSMNRDFTIIFIHELSRESKIKTASDLMAATGVRGIRMAVEVSSLNEIYMNDIDPMACLLISENVRRNNVSDKIRLYCEDVNILARSLKRGGIKIDFVDLDPYGSPAPYLDSILEVVKPRGFLSVTATDLAVLMGGYPRKALRRYGAYIYKTDFSREIGLRVLIRYIQTQAAEKDLVLKPLLSYYSDHYYKILFSIDKGADKSVDILRKEGFYRYCPKCHYKDTIFQEEFFNKDHMDLKCPICGSKMIMIGPVWLGELYDKELTNRLIKDLESLWWLENKKKIEKILNIINEEIDISYYYKTEYIASILKKNVPKIDKVIKCLKEIGYKASRTHLDETGFKTDAPYKEILRCF
ncbi:MAG: tRNA (guanine(10)-N(2))-dimethyltransferase [Desulfurococcaceae archaeon]|nr:tRNA (guanine(10)-N(2))-dimethyltransferase [Desulfurococcaceae archaeon]